jgi:hypothetical protein
MSSDDPNILTSNTEYINKRNAAISYLRKSSLSEDNRNNSNSVYKFPPLARLPSKDERLKDLEEKPAELISYHRIQLPDDDNHKARTRKKLCMASSCSMLLFALLGYLIVAKPWLHLPFTGGSGVHQITSLKKTKIPANIAPGDSGCSNFPLRGPNTSNDYGGEFKVNISSVMTAESNNYCSTRYTITECDLLAVMYSTIPPQMSKTDFLKNYIRVYLPSLITAMEIYDINCSPNRISTFLAQIKHETNSLVDMGNPTDGGSGSIHMIPAYFPLAIQQIPPLLKAYSETERMTFQNVKSLEDFISFLKSSPPPSPTDPFISAVGSLLRRPENTFLVGGWWIKYGATQIQHCEDLRPSMDAGLVSSVNAGFYRVSNCIFGTLEDKGLEQRISYFNSTIDIAKSWVCQMDTC